MLSRDGRMKIRIRRSEECRGRDGERIHHMGWNVRGDIDGLNTCCEWRRWIVRMAGRWDIGSWSEMCCGGGM